MMVLQDLKDLMVLRDHRVMMESWDLRVMMVLQDLKGLMVLRDHRVMME